MPLSIGDRLSAYEPAAAVCNTLTNINVFGQPAAALGFTVCHGKVEAIRNGIPGTQMTRSGLNKMGAWKIATYVQVNQQYCARRTDLLG